MKGVDKLLSKGISNKEYRKIVYVLYVAFFYFPLLALLQLMALGVIQFKHEQLAGALMLSAIGTSLLIVLNYVGIGITSGDNK